MGLYDKIKNAKQGTSLFDDIPADRMFALKNRAIIANAIYHERKRRGMSQAEFADLFDVAQPMVSKWESGEYNFSIDGLSSLFYRLDIPFLLLTPHMDVAASAMPERFTACSSEATSNGKLNVYDFKSYRAKYFALKEN